MSVDVASLPAWKLALLERKRRQEIDPDGCVSKSYEGTEDSLGAIPPWKQEILFRKQQKRHSTGRTFDVVDGENRRSLSDILLSPEDGDRYLRGVESWPGLLSPIRDGTYYGGLKTSYHMSNTSESGLDDVPVEEERLPPVHQNPILLLDLEKRQHSGILVGLNSPVASDSQQRSILSSKLSQGILDVDSSEHIQCQINEGTNDVFHEDEVTYGKGFVSRLLQKFSYLSGRDDQSIGLPIFRSLSRGESSEDFTRKRYDPEVGSKRGANRKKASSLDDLLAGSRINRSVVENGSARNGTEGTKELPSDRGGHEEVGIVLSAKSIFEGLATSPTSIKNPVQDRLYTSAKTQDAGRSSENHREPYRTEAKDYAGASFQPDSSSTAHRPAIIGPKPVYTGHVTSSLSSQQQKKKYPNAQIIGDVKSTKDTAEKTTAAQNSLTIAPLETDLDLQNTRSLSESQSLFESEESTSLPHDSSERSNLPNISPHIQEPSTTKEHVQLDSIPVPAQSPIEKCESGSTKIHEPPRKEIPNAPKKSAPLRPGLLLIRPASNLSSMRTEYLQMTKYNDITRGEFAPAKRVVHRVGGSEDDDDGESDGDEVDGERDSSKNRFEFEGAGVLIGRSLLTKNKQGIQLKIAFDDSITSTYEYPSEQCLIDSMPPEPGDADYPTGVEQNGKALPGALVGPNRSMVDSGPSASSASSTVSLSSYKSKTQVDFEFDTAHARKTDQETLAPSADPKSDQEVAATQSEVAVSWSDSTSSDHVLF